MLNVVIVSQAVTSTALPRYAASISVLLALTLADTDGTSTRRPREDSSSNLVALLSQHFDTRLSSVNTIKLIEQHLSLHRSHHQSPSTMDLLAMAAVSWQQLRSSPIANGSAGSIQCSSRDEWADVH